MKLSKKIRAVLFDRHVGLTFDWRGTGIVRWRILLWMIFFGLALAATASFIEIKIPQVKRVTEQAGAVIMLPNNSPLLERQILRKTPLPARGPVWADPVTAGPVGELSVKLMPFDDGDTQPISLPVVRTVKVEDQIWDMGQMPTAHIRAQMAHTPEPEMVCVPYLAFSSAGLVDGVVTAGPDEALRIRGDYTVFSSEFLVVVNQWGVPTQVLAVNESGSREADEAAMKYVQSFRWLPAEHPRSGTMTVEWKEEEVK